MWTIETADLWEDIFRDVYKWYTGLPEFLKNLQWFKGEYAEEEDFVRSLGDGLNYVGFENWKPKVLVHGELHSDGSVEGHMLCEPGADLELVISTVSFAKHQTLKNYRVIVSQVLRKHQVLHRVMMRSGFKDSGMRSWQGIYRGRPQEVLYFVAERN